MALTISGLTLSGRVVAFKEVLYWISTIDNGTGNLIRGITSDSSDNIYAMGRNLNGSNGFDLIITKFNAKGDLQWRKGLTAGSSKFIGLDMAVDPSGNVYATGRIENSANTNSELFLVKFDSSGSVLWQRTLGGSSFDNGFGIAIDSTGSNVYVVGETYSETYGNNDFLAAKYNSSGTIQWQRRYGTGTSELAWSAVVDNNGDLVVSGVLNSGANGDDAAIMKMNSSTGVLTWGRRLAGSLTDAFRGVGVDSSNNIYVSGFTASQTAGSNDFLIAKYNTSGAIQWQKRMGGAASDVVNVLRVDSSDYVYIGGNQLSSGPGTVNFGLAKFDSSGNVQWQRAIGTSGSTFMNGFNIDSTGSLILNMYADPVSNIGDLAVARIPSDGSLTGTYSPYIYQSVSLTVANTTLTDSALSLSSTATTLTSTTTSYTPTTYSVTATKISL